MNSNFILTEPRTETEQLKKQFYKKYKQQLQVQYQLGSWDMISSIVASGLGLGLVPDLCLLPNNRYKIESIKAHWFDCPYEVYLNEPKTNVMRNAAEAVGRVIRSEIKKV